MNRFSWYEAKSVEDAIEKANATASDILGKKSDGSSVIFKAGGVDLMDLMKEGLVEPGTVVSLKKIPGMDGISFDEKKGLSIGANTTLAE